MSTEQVSQLTLVEPPFINIKRVGEWPKLELDAECIHGNSYRFTVGFDHTWIGAGGALPIRLPARFGVPSTWPELVTLAYKVLTEAPCHHAVTR